MMQSEFEELAGPVSVEDFIVIEFVYNFYPTIDEIMGKQQIADIYKVHGMRMIRDMHPTACKVQKLEEAIREKRFELDNLAAVLHELRKGND